jgi:hypothetical protein
VLTVVMTGKKGRGGLQQEKKKEFKGRGHLHFKGRIRLDGSTMLRCVRCPCSVGLIGRPKEDTVTLFFLVLLVLRLKTNLGLSRSELQI